MLTEPDIKKFCSTDKHRKEICTVLYTGNEAVATDGHVMVCILSDHPRETEEIRLRTVGQIDNILSRFSDVSNSSGWCTIPDLPPEEERACPDCNGTGKEVACASCDGEGEIELDHSWQDYAGKWHNDDYTVECSHCEGTGIENEIIGGQCVNCHGTGKVIVEQHINFGFAVFDRELLAKVAALPGCKMLPGKRYQENLIRGDGWRGIIMPRREQDTDITVAWPE